MDKMGKRISTVELWKEQQGKGGRRAHMQRVEAPERDHDAGKMTGKAV